VIELVKLLSFLSLIELKLFEFAIHFKPFVTKDEIDFSNLSKRLKNL